MTTKQNHIHSIAHLEDAINFCVYSKSAKNTKIPPFFLQKKFLKSATKVILVFLIAFIIGQFVMKSYLERIENDLSARLGITPNTQTQQEKTLPNNTSKLESTILPAQTDFDTNL